ncbi:MAG: hypothetical protein K9W45_12710 [Candidatus Heimdallarchaeum aukensis]|uniref:Sm domain-containing protein n=1 Tax=Candidatus Heimdallarchaeum aukensis TaxID=2876573 RepID=A0A9Y1BKZ3_9ARCH|nr:MAG: hypothetical protein K9W45_12710 [Candidatus Heimdallarchaeum aukensis]
MSMSSIPVNSLRKALNKQVIIRLKDNVRYKGKLVSFDQNMNVWLRESTEIIEDEEVASYGDIFVRGNNILFVQVNIEDYPA